MVVWHSFHVADMCLRYFKSHDSDFIFFIGGEQDYIWALTWTNHQEGS